MKISLSLIALVCTLMLTSGCSYLRIYQAKSQFYNFSKHIDVEANDALVVKFKNPVLKTTDLVQLFGHLPTKFEAKETDTIMLVRFKNETDDKSVLDFTFIINANSRLAAIQIPKSFLLVLPDPVMKAFVNQYVVDSSCEANWAPLIEKIDDGQLKQLLGNPFRDTIQNDKHVIIYHFRREKCEEDKTENPICVIKYTLNDKTVTSIDANIEGMKFHAKIKPK
jgi:hypothetical protein